MKFSSWISVLGIVLLGVTSCGNQGNRNKALTNVSGDMDSYLNSGVNAIEQALPEIMVIPADQTLQSFGALKTQSINGKSYVLRDYQKYVNADDRFRRIVSTIQQAFIAKSYPLTDFEQTLKSLDTQEAVDMADDIGKDSKTLLLMTARPDIILELNYYSNNAKSDPMSYNYGNAGVKNVSYTLSAIDAYTNKTVATITSSNMKGESTTEAIQKDITKQIPTMMTSIQSYFSDILTRGREVSVRINVDAGSKIKLTDESIEGDTYADWIIDYMKSHTVKGNHKLQTNTAKELTFANVRIPLLNEDGTQYGVYDWTRDLQKNLRTNLGLSCTNRSQGLGDIVLTIKKL